MAERVVGVFSDMQQAERVIRDLRTVGFPQESIALTGAEESASDEHTSDETWTREGAIVGSLILGTVGAAMAFSGMALTPQVALLNALPHQIFLPLWMGFAGWLAGGIIGLGVAKDVEQEPEPGEPIVVSVYAPGRVEEARAIFGYDGALDVLGADAAELAARA
jgi:hypothetical protein